MRPRVSVVMATHDRRSLVPHTVEFVLAQTEGDWELIVVDDASTDGTPALLRELAAEDSRSRPLRLDANCGPGAARNAGIALAGRPSRGDGRRRHHGAESPAGAGRAAGDGP
jgi:glycosyltransferase involved in cell wall biosynthesis